MDQASSQVIAFQAIEAPSGRSANYGQNDGAPGVNRSPSFETEPAPILATPLQRMIEDILEPVSLAHRPVKEWRSLYRAFFAWFSPEGGAQEEERAAWRIASDAFNKNLTTVRNRATYVVPMTFQDFIDGVDAFKYDGLKESTQRDIAWQPKKMLLLMAAMIGRVVAGRQADALWETRAFRDPAPFQAHLVEANRRASFLGHVFQHDPRFSILDYQGAGLTPLLHSYPHVASALMENGLCRSEFFASGAPHLPPFLRLYFQRPLRVPISQDNASHLDVVLLRDTPALAAPRGDFTRGIPEIEFSSAPLTAAAFEPEEEWTARMRKIEQLFEWALAHRFLVGSGYQASQRSAAVLGQTLGRTPVEQFVIEQFFAHGFRGGSGNEPWNDPIERAPVDLARDPVKAARKQFERWRNTVSFFTEAGCPETVGIAGARIRHETLDPQGNRSSQFWALLHTPVYAPLMRVFLSANAEGEWVVKEQDLAIFSRVLNGDAGRLLLNCHMIIAQGAEGLPEHGTKATFLFECLLQTFLAMAAGVRGRLRSTRIEAVREALRCLSERAFTVTLTQTPETWWENPEQLEARVVAVKHKIREAEDKIWGLLPEPLSRKVAASAREAMGAVTQERENLETLVAPGISLENEKDFEKSVANLREWVKRRQGPVSAAPSSVEDRLILSLAELRILAEEGRVVAALDRAVTLLGLLKKSQRARLEPFFAALSRLLLAPLDARVNQGEGAKVNACADQARLLLAGTPALAEFDQAFEKCRQVHSADTAPAAHLVASSQVSLAPGQAGSAKQAQTLLRDFAEELALGENLLEQKFLQATASGTVFSRKKKLENRLLKLTRWGGREPHVTSLRLLRSTIEDGAC